MSGRLVTHSRVPLLLTSLFSRVPSKDGSALSQDELEVFSLAERAVLVALAHSRPIQLMNVPKDKKGYMETALVTDVCAFGIYPDLPAIEAASKGQNKYSIQYIMWR